MRDRSAYNNFIQTSNVVFGVLLVVAILVNWLVPLTLPLEWLRPGYIVLGVVLIIQGMSLVGLAFRELTAHGQSIESRHPTTHLVTTGVFSNSRNPQYLGVALFVGGAGLAINRPWVLFFLLVSLVICHFALILPEERRLEDQYGKEYREYRATVHRWIGRSGKGKPKT